MRTTETEYLSCAETAKLVRKALKRHFPGVKFSVRSKTYSGGASIDVSWIDGPRKKEVEPLLNAFAGADFDGMIDLKTYRDPTLYGDEDGNLREVSYGADFVFAHRSYSPETYRAAAEAVAKRWGLDLEEFGEIYTRESFRFKGQMVSSGFPGDRWIEKAGGRHLSDLVHRELEGTGW